MARTSDSADASRTVCSGDFRPAGTTPSASAARTAVLVHGFAQTPASWGTAAGVLARAGFRVEVPDLSRWAAQVPRSVLLMDALCERLARTLRAAAKRDGAAPVLVGYSMGGRIALETLVRRADVRELPLAGLLLESAGLGPGDEAACARFAERGAAWAKLLCEQGPEAFFDYWEELALFSTQKALPLEVRRRVREERVAQDAGALARFAVEAGQHVQAFERDSLRALGEAVRHGTAVCYVHGSEDASYEAAARRVADAVADVRIAAISGAGHNTHLEKPALFAEAMTGFLFPIAPQWRVPR